MENERLREAFNSAQSLLGKSFFVKAEFKKYAGLKARAELKEGKIIARVSDGFENAEREVLVGLALTLLGGLFKKKIDNAYTKAYKEFSTRETTSSFHDSLRKLRGRKTERESLGEAHDLLAIRESLFTRYGDILGELTPRPSIGWTEGESKRVLGFHDGAFNSIAISNALDGEMVPRFVVEYVVYHELLHCKHKVLFQRGESMRRTVHPKEFRDDEKKFVLADKAEQWIQRNL
ncbi:MAG TPA: hypothetical protein VJI71_03550 [Candidatus Norongarragalinales archaeon]|nr:hypothetical protein [Candidatus Norongarragalinales archaeon]